MAKLTPRLAGPAYPSAGRRYERRLPMLRSRLSRRAIHPRQRRQGAGNLSAHAARSAYDRYHFDRDEQALSGRQTWRSAVPQPADVLLHVPWQRHVHGARSPAGSPPRAQPEFHNTGLYNLPGLLSYPPPEYRPLRTRHAIRGRRQVQGAHAAQRGPHGTLHARRQHLFARRGVGALRGRRQNGLRGTPPRVLDTTIRTRAENRRFSADARRSCRPPCLSASLTDEEMVRDPRLSNPWRRT